MDLLPPFHPHLEVWGIVIALGIAYWWGERRLRPTVSPSAPAASRSQWVLWLGGLASILVSATWPVHDLAEETLFSFHMMEHMIIGYVTPPLLLVGLPRWMADRTLGHPRAAPIVDLLTNPVGAFAAFNLAIVAIHWPEAVRLQNSSEVLHLGAHTLLLVVGLAMWIRIFSPTPMIRRLRRPTQMLYLALLTIIPTIPASFLTFSSVPLYPVYGDSSVAWGISPVTDQTVAGLIMKLGGGFYLLIMIAVIWFRWYREEQTWDRIERELLDERR